MSGTKHQDKELDCYHLVTKPMIKKARKLAKALKALGVVTSKQDVFAEIERMQKRHDVRVFYLDSGKLDLVPVLLDARNGGRYFGVGCPPLYIEQSPKGCPVSVNYGFAWQTVKDTGHWPISYFERIQPPWAVIASRGEPGFEMIVLWHELGHHICFQARHEANGVHSGLQLDREKCATEYSFGRAGAVIESNKLSHRK